MFAPRAHEPYIVFNVSLPIRLRGCCLIRSTVLLLAHLRFTVDFQVLAILGIHNPTCACAVFKFKLGAPQKYCHAS